VYHKGADWQPYVVTDGKPITGQNPVSPEAAAKAVLSQLKSDVANLAGPLTNFLFRR